MEEAAMAGSLDLFIIDDDPAVCGVLAEMAKRFYTWGRVLVFTSSREALSYCLDQKVGVGVFVLDVFLGSETCFSFLDAILGRFPMAYQDSIIVTGNASDDVVNMCIASDVNYLLEKPIRPYALQFAVRSVVSKYLKFAKKLMQDPVFAQNVAVF
jgi:response regulator of citrate/malate metabolism